ncbi:MAG: GrpB family protein [Anaerolineaceae bacterium]|nr:GrpB family protein [Anaerolineaceae bacterium]
MITIIPYQEKWPGEFQRVALALRQALGTLALRIDHIGSTSVPGLSAKDVIDIQITVSALDDQVISVMTALGYTRPEGIWRDHRPPYWVGVETDWDKLFFKPPPGQRSTNTHVRVLGRANQRYALLFRDYLRAHPASAEAYAELKRRLAQNLAVSAMYPEVKDPAVDLIYFAAEDWAKATQWQPGLPDA